MYRKDPARLAALTRETYRVTLENGTEYPGTGEPLADFAPGLRVDDYSGTRVSGRAAHGNLRPQNEPPHAALSSRMGRS